MNEFFQGGWIIDRSFGIDLFHSCQTDQIDDGSEIYRDDRKERRRSISRRENRSDDHRMHQDDDDEDITIDYFLSLVSPCTLLPSIVVSTDLLTS